MQGFGGRKRWRGEGDAARCFSVCVPSDWSEPYSQPSRNDGESNVGPLQKLSTDRFRPGTAVLCLHCFQWNFVYSQISVRPLPPVKLKSEAPLPSHSVSEVPLSKTPPSTRYWKGVPKKFHFFSFYQHIQPSPSHNLSRVRCAYRCCCYLKNAAFKYRQCLFPTYWKWCLWCLNLIMWYSGSFDLILHTVPLYCGWHAHSSETNMAVCSVQIWEKTSWLLTVDAVAEYLKVILCLWVPM